MVNSEDRFVSIVVAKYALVEVISALAEGGITDYAITKEDNDLVIRISIPKLKWLKIKNLSRSYNSNEWINKFTCTLPTEP